MSKYFSASTKMFYSSDVHDKMPSDAVKITDDTWQNLLTEQSKGRQIVPDEQGNPVAVDPPAPPLADRQARIRTELAALETKTLRPMREIALSLPTEPGQPTPQARLADFERQMSELRAQLAALK